MGFPYGKKSTAISYSFILIEGNEFSFFVREHIRMSVTRVISEKEVQKNY